MGIKVEVKARASSDDRGPYPCLKISPQGRLVLFTAEKTGVQINNHENGLGDSGDSWAEYVFVPFYGDVTISSV